jgi:hypothetical protein
MTNQPRIFSRVALLALLGVGLSCHDLSGVGGFPSTIAPASSTAQIATPGTAVAQPPSVVVRDRFGAPVSAASVTFTVTSGGGSVTGGTALTDASGVATVGSWTFGTGPAANTLNATVGSLPPLRFTACLSSGTHAIGGSTTGGLNTSDCQFSEGSYVDLVNTTVTAARTYVFNLSSTNFDAYLQLNTMGGDLVGFNNNSNTSFNSTLKVLLPAADFTIAASSFNANVVGTYTIASAASSDMVTGCEEVWAARGITSDQSLQSTDCLSGGFFEDDYFIYLNAGAPVTISMNSTAIDSKLGLYFNRLLRASNNDKDATTQDAQLTYTPPVSGVYGIAASSAAAGITGAYTITIQ